MAKPFHLPSEEFGPFEQMVFNEIFTRSQLFNAQYDTRRDLDKECGYPEQITPEQYRKMFDRELGRRVVSIYPEQCWKFLPEIFDDPDPDNETDAEAALKELDRRLKLIHFMQRADEMSGVGHYGIMLFGVNDGKDLHEPVEGYVDPEDPDAATRDSTPDLTPTVDPRRITYIRVLDESLAPIAAYENDPKSYRFGRPTFYNVTFTDPTRTVIGASQAPPDRTQKKVHWHRVVHFADNRTTSEVLGTPRMQPVWNRLYDLIKILGGGAEMFYRGGFPGVSLESQPGNETAFLDEEKTKQMMWQYMNGLQRYLATTGMTAKSLAPQIAEPTSSFEVQIKTLCMIIGVPYRTFMGTEEGRLAGDQDADSWNSSCLNRNNRYVTPMVIRPILAALTALGALPRTTNEDGWTVGWPDPHEPSEGDRADVATKKTEALAKYVQGGVDTLIPPKQYLTLIHGMDEDDADMVLEAAVDHIDDASDEDTTVPGRNPTPPALEGEEGGGSPDDEDEDDDEDEPLPGVSR